MLLLHVPIGLPAQVLSKLSILVPHLSVLVISFWCQE